MSEAPSSSLNPEATEFVPGKSTSAKSDLNVHAEEFVPSINPSYTFVSPSYTASFGSYYPYYIPDTEPLEFEEQESRTIPFNDEELDELEITLKNEFLEKYKKKQICRFFLEGKCSYDLDCDYRHVNLVQEKKKNNKDKLQHNEMKENNNDKEKETENGWSATCVLCDEKISIEELLREQNIGFNEEEQSSVRSSCCHLKKCKELKQIKIEIANSKNVECAICMEPVFTATLGDECLLSDCIHVFHLECMKKWKSVKSFKINCPLCRTDSSYLIPCNRYITDTQRKIDYFNKLKEQWEKKPCKYWKKSQSCPFGYECYFGHYDKKGSLIVKNDSNKRLHGRPKYKRRSSTSLSAFDRPYEFDFEIDTQLTQLRDMISNLMAAMSSDHDSSNMWEDLIDYDEEDDNDDDIDNDYEHDDGDDDPNESYDPDRDLAFSLFD